MRLRVGAVASVLLGVVTAGQGSDDSTPRYSFVLDGLHSADLLPHWKERNESIQLDANRTQLTVIHTDPVTGLEVRAVTIKYSDSPAVEWTVYLKNAGSKDTPIIEDLRALDSDLASNPQENVVIHHNVGAPADGTDYSPRETALPLNGWKRLAGAGGRPTNSDLSYFNIALGDRGIRGEIVVVGWPGQWDAMIKRLPTGKIHIAAGQEQTHFKLHPGEEVRTPLVVTLPWSGDWIDGQNLWRRWMIAYGMPRPGGKLPEQTMLGYSGRFTQEMLHSTEENQIQCVDRYLQEKFKLDYWWMDAGWYVNNGSWEQTGTWDVDKIRFPNGLKPISDHAHARGVKTLLWFEPERVAPGTWLAEKHPEWLIGGYGALVAKRSSKLGSNEPFVLFNSGDRSLDWHGIHWPGHCLSMHPGPHGEYSVVRFIAPKTGDYRVQCAFKAIDPLATVDVHLFRGATAMFDSLINLKGHNDHAETQLSVNLAQGESLDFIVGFGEGRFNNDSTSLEATVAAPDGKSYDASHQFGSLTNPWSYGYLVPGAVPDPGTFRAYDVDGAGHPDTNRLLDLGNPTAWKWLVNQVDSLLVDNGIDLYRQDFNTDPLESWRSTDEPDRKGITENHYVVGYLAFWDELKRRHPNMLIDSCASGGRRNDLETLRRAVPLWESDLPFVCTAHQDMTYGISMWFPFYGTGTVANGGAPYYGEGIMPVISYDFWSVASPSLVSEVDVRQKDYDYDRLRQLFSEWRELGPDYYGDYYPLTAFSDRDDAWVGWQFHKTSSGEGFIQVFRRPNSTQTVKSLRLRDLDPKATYRFKILEGEALESSEFTGEELMSNGLAVSLHSHPQAAVITYKKL